MVVYLCFFFKRDISQVPHHLMHMGSNRIILKGVCPKVANNRVRFIFQQGTDRDLTGFLNL